MAGEYEKTREREKVRVKREKSECKTSVSRNQGTVHSSCGYRGHGALTYQWQRSSGDSNGDYSNIVGATASAYSDTGAPSGNITAGVASASDNVSSSYVTLSLAGETTSDGAGRYYKVILNATGCTQQVSTANRGYRGVGSLTYQWQRSLADSDAGYSNILGATADPYNDTGAPSDGSGRYYKAVLDASGATQQISLADRGYRVTVAEVPESPANSSSAGSMLLRIVLRVVLASAIIGGVFTLGRGNPTVMFAATVIGIITFVIIDYFISLL